MQRPGDRDLDDVLQRSDKFLADLGVAGSVTPDIKYNPIFAPKEKNAHYHAPDDVILVRPDLDELTPREHQIVNAEITAELARSYGFGDMDEWDRYLHQEFENLLETVPERMGFPLPGLESDEILQICRRIEEDYNEIDNIFERHVSAFSEAEEVYEGVIEPFEDLIEDIKEAQKEYHGVEYNSFTLDFVEFNRRIKAANKEAIEEGVRDRTPIHMYADTYALSSRRVDETMIHLLDNYELLEESFSEMHRVRDSLEETLKEEIDVPPENEDDYALAISEVVEPLNSGTLDYLADSGRKDLIDNMRGELPEETLGVLIRLMELYSDREGSQQRKRLKSAGKELRKTYL